MEKMFFFARSPCCGHKLICCRRKGYSHKRLFFFTRSSGIRRGLFSQQFSCVQEINSECTLLTIFNYLAEHLSLPAHCKQLLVSSLMTKKNAIINPGTPQYRIQNIPDKETFLTVDLILPVCFRLQQNWSFSHN